MKFKKISNQNGQALIVMALAAIALVGIVALAIDGSAKFSDRRHAQNAADTAALAGALALVNGEVTEINGVPVWKLDALNRAQDNGYDNDLLTNTVEVYLCSEAESSCGPYAGSSSYVQVIITSDVNTYFARVLGINQTRNTVQAVTYASIRGPFYRGDSIVALNPNPSCPGSFLVGGSGTVNLSGGGMYINGSGEDCVWEQQGCNVTLNITGVNGAGDPASITSAGGSIDVDDACSEQINATTSTSGGQYDFPPEMPEEPDECTTPNGTFSSNSGTKTTTLNPGRYNEFPPNSGGGFTVYDRVIMNPGIYCVNDVIKLVDKKLVLTGTDVTIYIRPGYKFSFEGGTIQLSATESGPYAGYVIIVASDFTGSPEACKIDGNTNNSFTGTIFAPYCSITINGASGDTSYNAQIIAYEVKLNGNNTINFTYDPDDTRWNEPKIGLMR